MTDEDEAHLRSTFGDDAPGEDPETPVLEDRDDLDCLYCGGLALGRKGKE